ncbi:MAG: EAL domain-containing protein, partial [Azoarcus sp.]|nr:EAL domain-containing protein [Azoarcus sp.]
MILEKRPSLGVAVALFWICMWTWAAIDMHITYGHDLSVTENNIQVLSRVLEGHLLTIKQKMDAHLIELNAHFREDTPVERNKLFDYLSHSVSLYPEVASFRVTDRNGKSVVGTDGGEVDLSSRKYFRLLRDDPERGLVISQPLISLVDRQCIVVFARRIGAPTREFRGIVLASTKCSFFDDFSNSLGLPQGTSLNLLSSEELKVIVHVPPAPKLIGKPMTAIEQLRDKLKIGEIEGSFWRFSNTDGIERFYGFHSMRDIGLPFVLLIGYSSAFVLDEWRQRTKTYLVLCTIITLISIFALREWNSRYRATEQLARQLALEKDRVTHESRIMMDSIPDPAWMTDTDGRYFAANKALLRFLGLGEQELIGRTIGEIFPSIVAETLSQGLQTAASQGVVWRHTAWVSGADKRMRLYEIVRVPVFDERHCPYRMVGIARELTDRYEAETRQRLITQLFDHDSEGLVVLDRKQRITIVNQTLIRFIGYGEEELLGRHAGEFLDIKFDHKFIRMLSWQLDWKGVWKGELRILAKGGERKPAFCRVVPLDNQHHRPKNWIVFLSDLSERKKVEERFKQLTTVDSLTGLPNRHGFLEAFDEKLVTSGANVLLILNLNRLSRINGAYGHTAGDRLLQLTAERLRQLLRANDLVGRLSDDNFAIVLDVIERQNAESVIQKIMSEIARPVFFEEQSITCTASIGACIIPGSERTAEELIRRADAAMRQARKSGANTYRFFFENLGEKLVQRARREDELRGALDRDELHLLYQPQVDVASSRIVGCEALLRWRHSAHGMVPPLEFIPLAEETGLILPIGKWVLDEACRQAKAWQDEGLPPITMAVNISAVQLNNANIIDNITDALRNSGLTPKWLELEITEGALVETRLSDTLRRLKSLGVDLAIDDFGTGYSSLAYLHRFPFDKLKIDQSFVRDMCDDKDAAAIVRMVVSMARELHLRTIAEGVETEAQRDFLLAHGCDI